MSSRRHFIIEAAIFLGAFGYLAFHTLPHAWRSLNTDFPNYYLNARLTHEGVDPSRAYEWIWLQRQKDHRNIDQGIVGLVPITPLSTLAMWPITSLSPLTAKHVWLMANLLLLIPIAFLLRDISRLSLLRIGILFVLSFPLHRNLLYGQYYIVLLLLLAAACWAVCEGKHYWAGALLGVAIAVKIFPVVLCLHLVRKRNWKALTACEAVIATTLVASTAVFGWNVHRTYLLQVLPWTLRGDCLDPYNLASSSLSSLLHRLLIYEPQLNPHPAVHAAWLFVVLHPLLQLALLAPCLLLIVPRNSDSKRNALEWSALLLVTLTITPLPASYHFTVLILPMAVLSGQLLASKRYGLFLVVALLYLGVGFPGWNATSVDGWRALLHVPRLYVLILLSSIALYMLRGQLNDGPSLSQLWWVAVLVGLYAVSLSLGLRHQRGLFDDYAYRLPIPQHGMLAAHPTPVDDSVHFIALVREGYREAQLAGGGAEVVDGRVDTLSLAVGAGETWTEEVVQKSVLRSSSSVRRLIVDAESPFVTKDGKTLAYLRQLGGRNQLFMRDLDRAETDERQLTSDSAGWNVYEAAFQPDGSIVMSATNGSGYPALYNVSRSGGIARIPVGEARYPAASPDGRWLAYSRFESGNWNLSLLERSTGKTHAITRVACNQIEPAWEPDSKTLLYSSDCGRALWFTALGRRRVVP